MSQLIVAQSLTLDGEANLSSPYGLACIFFAGRLVRDRFNILNQYSSLNWIDTVDPIPVADPTSISDLMDRRAQELIGKSISVQWSGGVDSTSLLLALIKNGISKQDLQILYDSNSVSEYPKLLNWLKEQGYITQEVKDWSKKLRKVDTDIITNGWCADQLFGSMFFHTASDLYSSSIPTFLSKVSFEDLKVSDEESQFAYETFRKYAKDLFGFNLTTAAELGWLINFCLKWTWVSSFNELFLAGSKNQFKTEVFFNTPYFQNWAIANFQNISKVNMYGKDAKYYKKDLKEYCNSIFPDSDFLLNKTKKPSWNARENTSVRDTYRIVLKTTEGYEIYQAPLVNPFPGSTPLIDAIFTKFRK